MNIMVFNVPAETVGALSILNDFYEDVKLYHDKSIKWTFVLSRAHLSDTDNINVLKYPWVKKSWLHRLYFDNFVAHALVKKYSIDKVVSFQNVTIPHIKKKQIVYVHNSLPFVDYKFSFKENKRLWIYQNIISKRIMKSIKVADKVIVQTEWMKKLCLDKTSVDIKKIDVIAPQVNIEIKQYFEPSEKSFSTFFYPASNFEYKNHKVIIEACKTLKSNNVSNFRVIFTLAGTEGNHIQSLCREAKEHNLPIDFVGSLERDDVFKLYSQSVLIFPSYIETFGLPLFEAKLHKGLIVASDCPFSHEILDNYKNAYFFNPASGEELFVLMNKLINLETKYHPTDTLNLEYNDFEFIKKIM